MATVDTYNNPNAKIVLWNGHQVMLFGSQPTERRCQTEYTTYLSKRATS